MAKRSRAFLWQFVIGLGFLSGLWTAIGIDPEALVLGALGTAFERLVPDPAVRTLFVVLPTLLLLLSVYGAYRKGGALGLAAVILAYLAGLSLLASTATALVLLLAAIAVGFLATRRKAPRR